MGRPKTTVIISSFNQGAFLERAICSVLDQGYDQLELFVADGGSEDDSLAVIRRYAEDLAGWSHEPDAGPAGATNHALTQATGEIVGVLTGGDLYLPGTLHAVADRMARRDRPTWLTGHCLRIGEQDEELGRLTAAAPWSLGGFLMHDSGFLPANTTFYHRSIFDRHGCFDPAMRFAYDYEISCRLLAAGRSPTVMPQMLGAQRDPHYSATAILQQGLEYVEAAERYASHLPLKQQYTLWRNCDERRRIYTLAAAEAQACEAKQLLWQRLLRRPWWLASDHYRRTLLHGVNPSTAAASPRTAAA